MEGMTLPIFNVEDDPGPSFIKLLKLYDSDFKPDFQLSNYDPDLLVHGTTVVATCFKDGIIIAGDRRATAGHLISKSSMKKVFAADKYSGIAISGTVGPAMEMVKTFQLQLEHYEKVEGRSLTLEGKANQLTQMLQANLPAAMQGLAVVPIFAGYDLDRKAGRLFEYGITGARYEETDYVASGSGSLFAKNTLKLGYKSMSSRDDAIVLILKSLFNAAEDDSATGGPDLLRKIFPIIAVIDKNGYVELEEPEIQEKFESIEAEVINRGAAS